MDHVVAKRMSELQRSVSHWCRNAAELRQQGADPRCVDGALLLAAQALAEGAGLFLCAAGVQAELAWSAPRGGWGVALPARYFVTAAPEALLLPCWFGDRCEGPVTVRRSGTIASLGSGVLAALFLL